jgi:hypothetical protein
MPVGNGELPPASAGLPNGGPLRSPQTRLPLGVSIPVEGNRVTPVTRQQRFPPVATITARCVMSRKTSVSAATKKQESKLDPRSVGRGTGFVSKNLCSTAIRSGSKSKAAGSVQGRTDDLYGPATPGGRPAVQTPPRGQSGDDKRIDAAS